MALTVDDILNATNDDLRATVRAICTDDSDVRDRLAKYLHRIQNPTPQDIPKSTTDTPPEDPSDLFVCGQCDKTFLETKNHETACVYHPGELEVNEDDDAWADLWENDHRGDPDDPQMQKDYPEGYKFVCCEEPGDHPGCKTGRHKTEETISKELSEPVVKSEGSVKDDSGQQQQQQQQQQATHQSALHQPYQPHPQVGPQTLPQAQPHAPTPQHHYPQPHQNQYQQPPAFQQPPQHNYYQASQHHGNHQPYPSQPCQQPQWIEPRPVQNPGPARLGFRYVNPVPPHPAYQPPPGYQWQYGDNHQGGNKRRRVAEGMYDSSGGYMIFPGQAQQ
ncbi:hypothetical protein QBC43DRAFT_362523 [Cladorrhinum sp. PSN259]|nr:hypothetical protein QBC43DRAFT_362523 [Cladorrhinum sp. PSN259]